MNFQSTILANNLTVIGEQIPGAHSVGLAFFVKTGARDEVPAVSGVSHFLEHMLFKGSEKRSAEDINNDLGRIGAQANAYTTEENTVYYATVLPEYFSAAVELLSDMMRPVLAQSEFDVEKKVILEEIEMYQDRPTFVLFERAMREFFGKHPAGNSVLGTSESITALTRDQMHAYFDARYVPSNIVLAAAGKFEWDELVQLAEKYCGDWIDASNPRMIEGHAPEKKVIEIARPNLQRSHVFLCAAGPSATDELRYPITALCNMLGDSMGSRCYWELVDKGLADSAGIGADDMDGVGMLYGYASTNPAQLAYVTEILEKIMKSAADFSEQDLERAKTKLATRLVLQGEGSRRRLMAIGTDWIYRGQYTPLAEELDKIQRLKKSTLLDALDAFSFDPVTKLTLIPQVLQ